MGKTYVFVNQKGGVGKTTSAINIGAYLALDGKKTLLVDFDSQGNMTSGVGVDRNKPTVYDLLAGTAKIDTVIRKSPVPGLSVIPASIDLSGAAIELVDQKEREFYLRRALEPVKDKFDYILIDCPPSLGILTLNGLVAADEVLIPLQCEYFALEGLTLLLQTVKRVQKSLNPDLGIGGIFFTMYDSRTRLAQDVVQQVTSYFKDRVFRTIIPRNVRLSEAPSHGLPICKYDALCVGARSYEKLAKEVIERG
ncbi:MAG TPA: AAA family ATPase [Treponemataceae bacterium]|jgi:chromosome partitioning protein|nr:ParA family protein [Treponema sp.]OQB01863.1 MAG: Sporulation initiation inhibitor protein Soj [Spirochaetes bacterium ADurb.Bin215]HOF85767.1 AAA family ATPase [Treponemataceae bacterium]HOS34963.1 AAA family ATPase [Treponemataceae bacterium]HOU38329.1 AAA family ATPase [Treponemataceae bacterium]